MKNTLLKLLFLCCVPVQASAAQFVQNGGFEQTVATIVAGDKVAFSSAGVVGWTGGSGITYVASPGSASLPSAPSIYPGLPATSPAGGNFVMADGADSFNGPFSQLINGMTVGATYTLSFYQAGGQAVGFNVPTTQYWEVKFGAVTQNSTTMNVPAQSTSPWALQTMSFVAATTSQTLTFLARGAPQGGPPISLLDGVSLTDTAIPEPATWGMMIVGFGFVGSTLRRRRQTLAAA